MMMMMNPVVMAPNPLQEGPTHVSIVLNASPGCCCCGPSPIQPGCFRQRVPGSAGEETVHYNTWAPAVPAVLAGRVDPAAWLNFINAISVLGESQPSCLVQCFTCSCAQAAADFAASLVQIEAAYMQPLGAVAMSLLEYSYETWDNGSEDTPGHWTWATLKYLRVDFPLPAGYAPMAGYSPPPPGYYPPGQQPQYPPQYAQQPPPPGYYPHGQPPQYHPPQGQPQYAQQQPMQQY